MAQPSLIVSLHDITTSTFDRVQRQLEELAALGISRTSLLVIPYYHGQARLDENKTLCDWLRQSQSDGHEIVLHGWLHQNLPSNHPRTWFYQNLYTSGEAEFLNLPYEEAYARIGNGLRMFRQLGFNVHGFIAPAWLMNPEIERATQAHGLEYTNTISELVHLPSGQRYSTRSCVWSSRTTWRRASSLVWNSWLFQRLKFVDPLRISLHPCDLEYPAVWRQIRDLVRSALTTRLPITYVEWIQTRGKL